jgi:hypothetical protein
MSKRNASKEPTGRLSKLLKSIDNNEKDKDFDDYDDDDDDKGTVMYLTVEHPTLFFCLIEALVPKAASRRLEELVDGEDDDLYRTSMTATTSDGGIDFRLKMELKPDHENRPLWVTPGIYSFIKYFA